MLRSDGILAFCMSTPIRDMCFDSVADAVTPQLVRNYFALSTFDDGHSVEHQLPYGDWVRLFRRHGLIIEDLIELQAPAEAKTSFADFVPAAWAREWPAEHIWKLRKDM